MIESRLNNNYIHHAFYKACFSRVVDGKNWVLGGRSLLCKRTQLNHRRMILNYDLGRNWKGATGFLREVRTHYFSDHVLWTMSWYCCGLYRFYACFQPWKLTNVLWINSSYSMHYMETERHTGIRFMTGPQCNEARPGFLQA